MGHIGQNLWRQIGTTVILCHGVDMGHGAIGHSLGDLRAHLIGEPHIGHRAHSRLRVQRVAQLVPLNNLNRLGDEVIIEVFMHVNPFDPAAALARVEHGPVDQRIDRRVQIGILHDIARVLAAQLGADTSKGARRRALHCLATADRPGEVHKVERIARDQIIGHVMAEEHILEHIRRHARRMEGLRHPLAHQQGLGGVFQDHRIARDQRRGHRVDRRHVRVIPGRHHKHHPMREALDVTLERLILTHRDIGQ
ncbi:hypothetical protein RUE5091_02883 [Ruegeria denitrificans]|uniref:Uncharacterized protein n=1 Tax=Ruegeria denitrificans TaxID=1715692 RepID=A0A0P1IK02_9RHOB|nr:hypothetical protein RUE5091_02883 [Ruegeria denitrificans]